MSYIAHINAMIVVEKEIIRRKGSGTPEVLFPKQIFDAIWGREERIPVKIVFESENRIVIERNELREVTA